MEKIRKITLASITSLFVSIAIFNVVIYEFNLSYNTISLALLIILFLVIDVTILKIHEKHSTNSLIAPFAAAIVISLIIGTIYASMLASKQASKRIQYEPEQTFNDNNWYNTRST